VNKFDILVRQMENMTMVAEGEIDRKKWSKGKIERKSEE
tara:strand:+ start:155 stop:271 length:117 start_codon:yes stop_codon:yes gene_type:complete